MTMHRSWSLKPMLLQSTNLTLGSSVFRVCSSVRNQHRRLISDSLLWILLAAYPTKPGSTIPETRGGTRASFLASGKPKACAQTAKIHRSLREWNLTIDICPHSTEDNEQMRCIFIWVMSFLDRNKDNDWLANCHNTSQFCVLQFCQHLSREGRLMICARTRHFSCFSVSVNIHVVEIVWCSCLERCMV